MCLARLGRPKVEGGFDQLEFIARCVRVILVRTPDVGFLSVVPVFNTLQSDLATGQRTWHWKRNVSIVEN